MTMENNFLNKKCDLRSNKFVVIRKRIKDKKNKIERKNSKLFIRREQ